MFNQFAKGSFTIDVTGPYHCGPDDTTPKKFDFEVELSYHDNALDERGFLIDNTSFKGYFDSLGRTELSCELLADKAASDLFRMVQDRCVAVKVAIWAIQGRVKIEKILVNPNRREGI